MPKVGPFLVDHSQMSAFLMQGSAIYLPNLIFQAASSSFLPVEFQISIMENVGRNIRKVVVCVHLFPEDNLRP